jgi:hypothetical protein
VGIQVHLCIEQGSRELFRVCGGMSAEQLMSKQLGMVRGCHQNALSPTRCDFIFAPLSTNLKLAATGPAGRVESCRTFPLRLFLGDADVVGALQIEPELRACAETLIPPDIFAARQSFGSFVTVAQNRAIRMKLCDD